MVTIWKSPADVAKMRVEDVKSHQIHNCLTTLCILQKSHGRGNACSPTEYISSLSNESLCRHGDVYPDTGWAVDHHFLTMKQLFYYHSECQGQRWTRTDIYKHRREVTKATHATLQNNKGFHFPLPLHGSGNNYMLWICFGIIQDLIQFLCLSEPPSKKQV